MTSQAKRRHGYGLTLLMTALNSAVYEPLLFIMSILYDFYLGVYVFVVIDGLNHLVLSLLGAVCAGTLGRCLVQRFAVLKCVPFDR